LISPAAKIDWKGFGEEELISLVRRASESKRRRANRNLHSAASDPIQRFLNAVEPDSYIRPHRHLEPPKWELLLILRGRGKVLLFDDAGRILEGMELQAGGRNLLVEIPEGIWHTLISQESGTVFFELKAGPYYPFSDKDFAPWAPREEDPAARDYVIRLQRAEIGDTSIAAANV
jgi:cupin fold WbuC family metalloprotein